ncbi:hypothetical protein L1887_59547 [Cichorium endivia]|nr:hypothetical protein L1887_59547 [Cichorium endivia]
MPRCSSAANSKGSAALARNLHTKGCRLAQLRGIPCVSSRACVGQGMPPPRPFQPARPKARTKEELPFGACDVGKRIEEQRATTRLRVPRPSSLGRLKPRRCSVSLVRAAQKHAPYQDGAMLIPSWLDMTGPLDCNPASVTAFTCRQEQCTQRGTASLECQSAASLLPCRLQHAPAALRTVEVHTVGISRASFRESAVVASANDPEEALENFSAGMARRAFFLPCAGQSSIAPSSSWPAPHAILTV